jgi:anti-anti-sigma regulatory factor
MSDAAEPGNTVTLSGPKTLYESSEVRELLRSELEGRESLLLDLETSGPWDLAGLQLLVAAVASGRQRNVQVRLVNVPSVCTEIAQRSGLDDWLKEHADSFL